MMSDGAKSSQEGSSDGGGVFSRLVDRLKSGRRSVAAPEIDDPDLRIVVWSDDDAAASSTVLDAAGFESGDPVVLRHLLAVPGSGVGEVTEGAALGGYEETDRIDRDPEPPTDMVGLALAKVMKVDARTLSQERSRMASLASRAGGRTIGWAILASGESGPGR